MFFYNIDLNFNLLENKTLNKRILNGKRMTNVFDATFDFKCRYIMEYYLIRFLPVILHFCYEIAIHLITLWAVPLSFVPHGHLYLRMAIVDIMMN